MNEECAAAIAAAVQEVSIDRIVITAFSQIRVEGTNPAIVAEYGAAMEAGASLPPVILFYDSDAYFAADGFHRIDAAKSIGRATISAVVREGSLRDAVFHAVGANADHGLRRSQADRRNAVLTLLKDPEWSRLSDRKIGEAVKVDHKTISKIRRELTGEFPTPGRVPTPAPATPSRIVRGDAAQEPASMVERMLRSVSDEALIAEAARRGMEVRR